MNSLMIMMILLALTNGVCIGLSRILNGLLSQDTNAFNASLWNHVVGFTLLSLLLTFIPTPPLASLLTAPVYTWFGGVLGTFFVAINSYVLSRIGATMTALLVITGQLVTGVVFDAITTHTEPFQLLGILLIIIGVLLTKWFQFKSVSQNIQLKTEEQA